ncbi:hypothetical protein [Sporomusa sp. KB1]|uniref:hypothetical protein n=1 Tax=Sporomusa sp. KB1 TaxID=943346 RepID=UPI0011A792DF|nr:hypothetical protein [Sporomusa sp. KB1]TWH49592.1 hypothetical protein Salpa_5830 [Sporomusa sp. KB1]
MKKIVLMFWLLIFSIPAFAADVYCGDYQGHPVYLRTESITKNTVASTNTFTVFQDEKSISVFPEYSHYYEAHLITENQLYRVLFSESLKESFLVEKILNGYNKETMHDMDLNFVYNAVVESYTPETQKANAEYSRNFSNQKYSEQYDAKRKLELVQELEIEISMYRHNKEKVHPEMSSYKSNQAHKGYTRFPSPTSEELDQKYYKEFAEDHKNEILRLSKFFSTDELIQIADKLKFNNEERVLLLSGK